MVQYEIQHLNPEQALWGKVVEQAILDIKADPISKLATFFKAEAYHWFKNKNESFKNVCKYAGLTPEYVSRKTEHLVEENKEYIELYYSTMSYYSNKILELRNQKNKFHHRTKEYRKFAQEIKLYKDKISNCHKEITEILRNKNDNRIQKIA